jgi:hypothetical protein
VRAAAVGALGVGLDGVVALAPEHREEVLAAAAVARVEVEGVVADIEDRQVVDVDGAAKELEAVVERVRDLDVRDDGAAADARQREPVDLVVLGYHRARVPHAHVPQHAARVVGVAAAVVHAVETLDARLLG